MSTVQATLALYNQLGILTDCVRLSSRMNRQSGMWEVWGHFHNANGHRSGRVAQFDAVEDAIDFVVLAGF